MHNIPEGLAVGVAFGAVAAGFDSASLTGAIALAIGIGIQNFPEGVAVSMPLRRDGMSRARSFMYGQFSGLVEPIAAMVGAVAVVSIEPLLPYALSFAAGAMIFVVARSYSWFTRKGKHRLGFHKLNGWFCRDDDSRCCPWIRVLSIVPLFKYEK